MNFTTMKGVKLQVGGVTIWLTGNKEMLEAKWKDNREMKDVTMADFLMQQSKWQLKKIKQFKGTATRT